MLRVKIDLSRIKDKESFHDAFAEAFGFPDWYGRNMDAWIDCMGSVNDPESGMTSISCSADDFVVLELENVTEFKKRCPDLYRDLIECSGIVNWRNLESGISPVLMHSFNAS